MVLRTFSSPFSTQNLSAVNSFFLQDSCLSRELVSRRERASVHGANIALPRGMLFLIRVEARTPEPLLAVKLSLFHSSFETVSISELPGPICDILLKVKS